VSIHEWLSAVMPFCKAANCVHVVFAKLEELGLDHRCLIVTKAKSVHLNRHRKISRVMEVTVLRQIAQTAESRGMI